MSLLDGIKDKLRGSKPSIISNDALADIERNLYTARQFVFDAEASRTVGRFMRECPDVMADNLEFAIPPYNPCYIEVDLDGMYKELRSNLPEHQQKEINDVSPPDYRAGFYFIRNRVYVLTNDRDNPDPFIAVYGTYFTNGPTPRSALSYDEGNDDFMVRQLLGTTYNRLSPLQRKKFVRCFGVFHCASDIKKLDSYGARALQGSMGEARTIVGILLMLYNKRHVTLTERPAQRLLSRGKMRAYMAHTTVQISLTDPIEIRRAFNTGERGPYRRHEVRTHYAHRRIQSRCEHQWVRNEYADNEQWECSKCHGLRYLVREHLRGDGSVGFVNKRYEVKP